MNILVVGNGWGENRIEFAQMLANAVYDVFSKMIGKRLEYNIIVNNEPSQGYPLAHFEKKGNCWEITLSCVSGMHWSQMAYQLAHELCHLYCNHASYHHHKHKWFEESLCECASIAVLKQLSIDWECFEISKADRAYAKSLNDYIESVINNTEIIFDNSESFLSWLIEQLPKLETSSTNRDLNRIIALYLYTFLLKYNPNYWESITTLNLWNCSLDKDFISFLTNWELSSSLNKEKVNKMVNLILNRDNE